MKTIERLIVCAVLLTLAFVFGCKDKAEGVEFVDCTFEVVEPSEPEYRILTISERVNQAIPTWPNYIELEKDLVLRYDFPEPNNPLLIHFPNEFRIFSKGTKIYFKD